MNETISLRINIANMTSNLLIDRLYQSILEYENSINGNKIFDTKKIIGFRTRDKYFVIDYILAKHNHSLEFMKKKTIYIVPLFKESKINEIYS